MKYIAFISVVCLSVSTCFAQTFLGDYYGDIIKYYKDIYSHGVSIDTQVLAGNRFRIDVIVSDSETVHMAYFIDESEVCDSVEILFPCTPCITFHRERIPADKLYNWQQIDISSYYSDNRTAGITEIRNNKNVWVYFYPKLVFSERDDHGKCLVATYSLMRMTKEEMKLFRNENSPKKKN